ncbi:MAG: hypothetical protein QF735_04905 [Phycisphaeraceae bacterium]|nr:hypothetical protein [Phycisphaeraceae bacterium]
MNDPRGSFAAAGLEQCSSHGLILATAVNDQPDSHVPIIVAARLHVAVTPHPTGQAMLL